MTARRFRSGAWGAVALIALPLVLLGGGCDRYRARPEAQEAKAPAPRPASVSGTLRVSAYGAAGSTEALGHVHTWVNGLHYGGMEDNDLRGFLDGRFIYGWNQPRQVHNRMGRRGSRPRWGETELFRTLMRWDGIDLPERARVTEARIEIAVEETPKRPVDVMLYEVRGDWNPGEGGERKDNTSPPLPGEVWWGERAAGQEPWGFPGAGWADEADPRADTPVSALAQTRVEQKQESFVLGSEALAQLIERRARAGQPLDLMLKVSDDDEDTPGTVLYIYAGNHGDRRNEARRPRLVVGWEAPQEIARLERPLLLEHDRTAVLPRLAAPGARRVAVSFEAVPGSESPLLSIRGGAAGEAPSPWQSAALPRSVDWDWVEVRAQASIDPVMLGEAFETGFRDTWVRTAPPEEQAVRFTFVAPSGKTHPIVADYEGDYTWKVAFVPDELGRHTYRFEHDFLKRTYYSADGQFDVVVGDLDHVERALRALLDRVGDSEGSDAEIREEAPLFWRLERALYQQATPEQMEGPVGERLYALLTEIRAALSGRAVPDEAVPKPMRRDF